MLPIGKRVFYLPTPTHNHSFKEMEGKDLWGSEGYDTEYFNQAGKRKAHPFKGDKQLDVRPTS